MKAKNAHQRKVTELSSLLPTITEDHKIWSSQKIFLKWGVISRNKMYCLDCAHSWTIDKKENKKCPNCNSKLKIHSENAVHFKEKEYFAILTTVENYQVVRIVCSEKHMKKSELPTYCHSEVMQHWINEQGEVLTLAKCVQGFNMEYDRWRYDTELTIKDSSQRGSLRYRINPWKIYPNSKVLPILKRNGFKGSTYSIAPQVLFTSLLTDSTTETLLKTGQINALNYYLYKGSTTVTDLWSTIKICTKNKYIIKDFSIYSDYIDLLKYFVKDLHCPKYICPANLNHAHDKLVAKKRAIQKLEKLEKLKKQMSKDQKLYSKQKKAFFGLQFSDRNLTIKVIESVREFLEEGDEHKHCVFTNEYYKEADSLILSATIGDRRIETIEISLSKREIVQSRGKKNKATKYNEKIINLVNKNLHKIDAIYKKAS